MEGRDRPRRPAILDPKEAELLWGDSDPALASEAAHATANAVLYGPSHHAEDEQLAARVGAIIDAEGLDEIAALWSRSPATTLPGALWRLYLIRAWLDRDPDTISRRFGDGRQSTPAQQEPAEEGGDVVVLEPDEMREALDQLFAGTSEREVADVLDSAAFFLRTLAGATGSGEWEDDDDAARPVTRRPNAITATADELGQAALRARAGTLD